MEKHAFEDPRPAHEKELREKLEETRRMIIDTKAEVAQVKEDAAHDLAQTKKLVSLKQTLDTLEYDEVVLKKELEGA